MEGMDQFVANGSEIHSDGCTALRTKWLRFRFGWIMKNCVHSKAWWVLLPPHLCQMNTRSEEKVHNNNSETWWRLFRMILRVKAGVRWNSAEVPINNFISLLHFDDWKNHFTTRDTAHIIKQWFQQLAILFPAPASFTTPV